MNTQFDKLQRIKEVSIETGADQSQISGLLRAANNDGPESPKAEVIFDTLPLILYHRGPLGACSFVTLDGGTFFISVVVVLLLLGAKNTPVVSDGLFESGV